MHQCIKFILFWNDNMHVSDGLSVNHQEFKTVHTATGMVLWMSNVLTCLDMKLTLIQLLFLFNKHNMDHLKIQTHSEISRFTIVNEACPTQWRVSCTRPLESLISSNDNSDSDKFLVMTILIVIWHLKQVVPHLNPVYKHKEILITLFMILICLKKQDKLLSSRLRGWNILYQDNEICSFCNCQNEFKEFFSQENDLVFCNDDCSVIEACSVVEALEHQHDPAEWCLFIDTW